MNELTVLAVESERPVRQRLQEVLSADLGVRVRAVGHGLAGLGLAAAASPDLVLLDLALRDVDALEVLRELRREPATSSVPVIVVGAAGSWRVAAALAEGADDAIAKPFDLDELCSRVALWAWRGARRARSRAYASAPVAAPV